MPRHKTAGQQLACVYLWYILQIYSSYFGCYYYLKQAENCHIMGCCSQISLSVWNVLPLPLICGRWHTCHLTQGGGPRRWRNPSLYRMLTSIWPLPDLLNGWRINDNPGWSSAVATAMGRYRTKICMDDILESYCGSYATFLYKFYKILQFTLEFFFLFFETHHNMCIQLTCSCNHFQKFSNGFFY